MYVESNKQQLKELLEKLGYNRYYYCPQNISFMEILRKKNRLYVISPIELREKVLKNIKEMGKNTKSRKKLETVPRDINIRL